MARFQLIRSPRRKSPQPPNRLDSWKEIAVYLNRSLRTVQRWEKEEGLPVHRLRHEKKGSVYAFRNELDAWWESRRVELGEDPLKSQQPADSLVSGTIHRSRLWVLAFFLIVLVGAGFLWLLLIRGRQTQASPQLVPLTSHPLEEYYPSFSPDGDKIVYSWLRQNPSNFDLFLIDLNTRVSAPLLTTPDYEGRPSWSPDGNWIAFGRLLPSREVSILRISPIGGPEQELFKTYGPATVPETRTMLGVVPRWSPDGKWMVVLDRDSLDEPYALFAVSLSTFEKHRLTKPPAGWLGDGGATFSPDGRTLVFHRLKAWALGELYSLRLDEEMVPQSSPQQLTFLDGCCSCPVFMANGEEIVFSYAPPGHHRPGLARMSLFPGSRPKRLDFAPTGAYHPTLSTRRERLAYAHHQWVTDIYEVKLDSIGKAKVPPSKLIQSTALDLQPAISPNGKHIAFTSSRSGSREIYKCDRDGSNVVRLTFSEKSYNFDPTWAPDGTRIAYSSDDNTNQDIYTIDFRGGSPERLTVDAANDNSPAWSGDGQWVYFTSNRSGTLEIWRVSTAGGFLAQVTNNGGWGPRCSPDSKSLYYFKGQPEHPTVWQLSLQSGEKEALINAQNRVDQFVPAEEGVYFTTIPKADGRRLLCYYESSSRRVRQVAELETSSHQCSFCMPWEEIGLSLAPDRGAIVYGQIEYFSSDLMLVEDFQ